MAGAPSCGPGLTALPCCLFSRSARGLEKVRQQLQDEVRQASSQLLAERRRRETQEALARRLQKRVLLLTKVCTGRGPQAGPSWGPCCRGWWLLAHPHHSQP